MQYFDSHSHIQFPKFDEDRTQLLARMHDAGVGSLVVGVDYASSQKAIELATTDDALYASIGLHPNDTPDEPFDEEKMLAFAAHSKVIAIGECGLDNYRPEDPEKEKARQRAVFEQHVQLAVLTDKPLMIHSRPSKGTMDAYRDLIAILSSYKKEHGEKVRGDIHFFVGGIDEARALIELGFTLSFTAVVTFARDYDEVVRYAPLTSILSETDAPYIAPASRRGERNDPLAIPEIVRALAGIRAEDEETVRQAILTNAEKTFRISLT